MQCFACGLELVVRAGERVGFRDACDCGADLHVCRNCAQHDLAAHNECREPQAEPVRDRDRANRCDWFAPRQGPLPAGDPGGAAAARNAVEALFKKRP